MKSISSTDLTAVAGGFFFASNIYNFGNMNVFLIR